jgi:streptogramin lyase
VTLSGKGQLAKINPAAGVVKTYLLPTPHARIRNHRQPSGRLWHTGSHNGRLGVIE